MKIKFKWIGGATWILSVDHVKIACDPVLCSKGGVQDYGFFKTVRLNDPVYDSGDFENIDLWLLTHNHEDHLDANGLSRIDSKSNIVCHGSVPDSLPYRNSEKKIILKWGEIYNYDYGDLKISIKSVPGIHSKIRILSKIISDNNGYVLTCSNKKKTVSFYITGDDVFNEKRLKKFEKNKIDFVIANAGSAHVGYGIFGKLIGRITNNTDDILTMIESLNAKYLFPVHYGTFKHYLESNYDHLSHESLKIVKPGGDFEWEE